MTIAAVALRADTLDLLEDLSTGLPEGVQQPTQDALGLSSYQEIFTPGTAEKRQPRTRLFFDQSKKQKGLTLVIDVEGHTPLSADQINKINTLAQRALAIENLRREIGAIMAACEASRKRVHNELENLPRSGWMEGEINTINTCVALHITDNDGPYRSVLEELQTLGVIALRWNYAEKSVSPDLNIAAELAQLPPHIRE